MQWTAELDALLNQCAFSAGYDFAVTCAALKPRAARLRLDSDALTAAACEAQWMLLNPVVEDDELDGPEHDPAEEADPCDWMLEGLGGDTTPSKLGSAGSLGPFSCQQDVLRGNKTHNHRATEASRDLCSACSSRDDASTCTMSSCHTEDEEGIDASVTPRLELSISETELDELLRELPATDAPSHADGKDAGRAKSEMQWVLAFLTDPDTAANVDTEAKQLAAAASASDIHDDDNYKGFLKDLSDANLLVSSPKKPQPVADTRASTATGAHLTNEKNANRNGSEGQPHLDEEDDSDNDIEEWTSTRRQMKQRSGHGT